MNKYILIPILFLLLSNSASADYDSRKYIPQWVPYNYEDAVKLVDFQGCQTPLDKFDEIYFELEWKEIPGSDEGTTWVRYEESDPSPINTLEQLQDRVESEIRDCIAVYPDYIAKKEAEQAEKMAQLEAEEEAEERARQIQISLERCDLEFFETFSTDEKMQTYDERVACEEDSQTSESEEHSQTQAEAEVVPEVVPPTPAPVPTPPASVENEVEQYVPPAPAPEPVRSTESESQEPKLPQDPIQSTSTGATSSEVIKVTQQELDRMVEERANEKASEQQRAQPEPELPEEPEPTFFKRVTNFLFGWMF